SGAGGAKGGDQGECGPAKHVPGAEPDKRVTGAGTHTAICRHTPEVGAVCGKAARTVLCGGRAMKRTSLPLRAPGKAGAIQPVKVRPKLKGSVLLGSECCVATGDGGCEAYTAIAWGVGLSHERSDIAGAEGFHSLEGNMCGTVMRGADALPGSKATSRAKGSHRNLGGLGSGRQMLRERDGPHREGEEPKPMMHGHEKSDLVIVAVKPTN